MPIILGSFADITLPAPAESLARNDAVAHLEAVHVAPRCKDGARAFVACCDREFDGEGAFEVFEVAVAEGGGGDFD